MEKNSNSRIAATSNKYQVNFDETFIKNVRKTVSQVLYKNASSWIRSEYIDEISSMAITHIYEQKDLYDPSRGTFPAWYMTVARNFAIKAAERQKKALDSHVSISSLSGFDGGMTEVDPEKRSRSKKIDYRSDSTFALAAQGLGISLDDCSADYAFTKASDEAASLKRLAKLEDFLRTRLSDKEKAMLGLQDGPDGLVVNMKTKEQMMDELHITSENAYTRKCRLCSKIKNFLTSSEYIGDDEE